MTDMDKLIEAVEAGEADLDQFPAAGNSPYRNWIVGAYRGSLDAAHRLHEALLPGWGWEASSADRQSHAEVWTDDDFDAAVPSPPISARSATPARAWLLAILRAVKAQEGK